MMSSLNLYGEDITEQRTVEKLPCVIPRQYKQVAVAIDTLLDTADLSIVVTGHRLKGMDNDDAAALDQPIYYGSKLYFTEEQWLARSKQRQDGEGSSKPPKPGGGARRRSRGGCKQQARTPDNKDGGVDDEKDRCQNCGCLGHWALGKGL